MPSPDQLQAFRISQGHLNDFLRSWRDYAYAVTPTRAIPAVVLTAFLSGTDANMELLNDA